MDEQGGAMTNEQEEEPWAPPFANDFERFYREVMSKKTFAERLEAYPSISPSGAYLRDILCGELLRAGFLYDLDMMPELREFYQWVLANGMPAEHRWQVLRHITEATDGLKHPPVYAYLPMMLLDPDRRIAATATIDYVSRGPLSDGDPLAFPKDVIESIKAREPANIGAVFGALLHLGDPRVCKLLWPLKDSLSPEEANEAACCPNGFIYSATVEFMLDWLEEREGNREDRLFGSLASGLILQKRVMMHPFVSTGLRPFPVNSVTPEEFRAMQQWIPFDEYAKSVAPRMLALERAEEPPKAMSLVISAWGIGERDLSMFGIRQ
jgi:hypothetical protein